MNEQDSWSLNKIKVVKSSWDLQNVVQEEVFLNAVVTPNFFSTITENKTLEISVDLKSEIFNKSEESLGHINIFCIVELTINDLELFKKDLQQEVFLEDMSNIASGHLRAHLLRISLEAGIQQSLLLPILRIPK